MTWNTIRRSAGQCETAALSVVKEQALRTHVSTNENVNIRKSANGRTDWNDMEGAEQQRVKNGKVNVVPIGLVRRRSGGGS